MLLKFELKEILKISLGKNIVKQGRHRVIETTHNTFAEEQIYRWIRFISPGTRVYMSAIINIEIEHLCVCSSNMDLLHSENGIKTWHWYCYILMNTCLQ